MKLLNRTYTDEVKGTFPKLLLTASLCIFATGLLSFLIQNFFTKNLTLGSSLNSEFISFTPFKDWKLSSENQPFNGVENKIFESKLHEVVNEDFKIIQTPKLLQQKISLKKYKNIAVNKVKTKDLSYKESILTQQSTTLLTDEIHTETSARIQATDEFKALSIYSHLQVNWKRVSTSDFNEPSNLNIQIATTQLDPPPVELEDQNSITNGEAENFIHKMNSRKVSKIRIQKKNEIKKSPDPQKSEDEIEVSIQTLPLKEKEKVVLQNNLNTIHTQNRINSEKSPTAENNLKVPALIIPEPINLEQSVITEEVTTQNVSIQELNEKVAKLESMMPSLNKEITPSLNQIVVNTQSKLNLSSDYSSEANQLNSQSLKVNNQSELSKRVLKKDLFRDFNQSINGKEVVFQNPLNSNPSTLPTKKQNSFSKQSLLSEDSKEEVISETSYTNCTTGIFGKRALTKRSLFQSELSVCKRILSSEGFKDNIQSQWIEARATEENEESFYPTIVYQKWNASEAVFNRIPMLSKSNLEQLEFFTGTKVENALGIVFGEISEGLIPEWMGRAERPLFLSENLDSIEPANADTAKYFVYLNVKLGANLLSFKNKSGKTIGAIAPLVKAGTVTFIKTPKVIVKDLELEVLDGTASERVPEKQMTIEIIGQESKTAITNNNGFTQIKDVNFFGDYPIFIDSQQSSDGYKHRYSFKYFEIDEKYPLRLFNFKPEVIGHWLMQVDNGVSSESGLIVGARRITLKQSPDSYMRLFKMEGAPSLHEEFYGIGEGEGLLSEKEVTKNESRFLMTQVPEGMHVLGDLNGSSVLKWSETIIAQPGVINVTRAH